MDGPPSGLNTETVTWKHKFLKTHVSWTGNLLNQKYVCLEVGKGFFILNKYCLIGFSCFLKFDNFNSETSTSFFSQLPWWASTCWFRHVQLPLQDGKAVSMIPSHLELRGSFRDLVSHPSIQNISDCIKAKYNKKKKRPNHPYTSGEGRVTAPLSQIGNLISSTRTEMLFDVRCCHLSGFLIHCYCLWRCWGFLTDKQQGGLLLNWQRRSI